MSLFTSSEEKRVVGPPAVPLVFAKNGPEPKALDPGVAAMLRKAVSDKVKEKIFENSKPEEKKTPHPYPALFKRRWSPPGNPYA